MYVSLCTYCKALLVCVNIEINIKRKVCRCMSTCVHIVKL